MADDKKKGSEKESPKPAGDSASGEAKSEGKPAAKPAPPKPPAAKTPPKEKPGPKPHDDDLIRRLRARFGDSAGEATIDRGQVIVIIEAAKLIEVCEYLQEDEKFDYLADLTAVHRYGEEKRFEVILNLYSMEHNQSLRLKVFVPDEGPGQAKCPSVSGLWGAANWLERECYDMFGIVFEGHPNLKRILLPVEWQGHPLRKDYDILKQDDRWVQENLGIESGQ